AEKCLRTQLISVIEAPLCTSARWKTIMSCSVTWGASGSSIIAEAPPLKRKMTKAFSSQASGGNHSKSDRTLRALANDDGLGNGCPPGKYSKPGGTTGVPDVTRTPDSSQPGKCGS